MLELLAPREDVVQTPRAVLHLLGRTLPGATVRVGGEPVTVYATGEFVKRDGHHPGSLAPGTKCHPCLPRRSRADGRNRSWADAHRQPAVERALDIARWRRTGVVWPADRLLLNGGSLRPAEALRVAPGEAVDVAVQATPGQRADARLPGQAWHALAESRKPRRPLPLR